MVKRSDAEWVEIARAADAANIPKRPDAEWLEIARASDAAHIQKLRDEKRTSKRDIAWKEQQLESEPDADKIKRAKTDEVHAKAKEERRAYLASQESAKPETEKTKAPEEKAQRPGEEMTDAKARLAARREQFQNTEKEITQRELTRPNDSGSRGR